MGNSVIFQVALALTGIVLAFALGHAARRPKVRLVGMGAGSAYTVHIINEPRLFRVRGSSLFGMRIHPEFTIGPVIETSPARGLLASLYEKDGEELITHLFWQLNNQQIMNAATLSCRETAELLVFHRGSESHRYYVWRPNVDRSAAADPPVVEAQYSETREFRVELHDGDGRRKLRFWVKMILGPDGQLGFHSPAGSC